MGRYEHSKDVKLVPISKLRGATFNPKNRTEKAKITMLMASIKRHGILAPILVTTDYEIGDGHRRFTAAKESGEEFVPCKIIPGMTAAQIYKQANSNAIKATGNENLGVYLVEPEACPTQSYDRLARAEKMYGRGLLEYIYDAKGSIVTVNIIGRILRYCGRPNNVVNTSAIARWLLELKQTDRARWAIQTNMNKGELWTSIINMLPVEYEARVGEKILIAAG